MSDFREWPGIDFDAMAKGDRISRGEVAEIVAVNEDDDPHKFRFEMMRLMQFIRNELARRGRPWTVCEVKGDVAILTDEEASKYNDRRFNQQVRGALVNHAQNLGVDVSNLSAAQLQRHDRNLSRNGAIVAAIANARRELHAAPYRRDKPGLPKQE